MTKTHTHTQAGFIISASQRNNPKTFIQSGVRKWPWRLISLIQRRPPLYGPTEKGCSNSPVTLHLSDTPIISHNESSSTFLAPEQCDSLVIMMCRHCDAYGTTLVIVTKCYFSVHMKYLSYSPIVINNMSLNSLAPQWNYCLVISICLDCEGCVYASGMSTPDHTPVF